MIFFFFFLLLKIRINSLCVQMKTAVACCGYMHICDWASVCMCVCRCTYTCLCVCICRYVWVHVTSDKLLS